MELTTRLELQSQTTRLYERKAYTMNRKGDEAITLHGGAFLQHLPLTFIAALHPGLQFSCGDFNDELFLLHSPLLKES